MKTDSVGKAEVGLDWLHSLVHDSKVFSVSISNTIGAAGTLALHITTPSTKNVHIEVKCSANKSGVLILAETDTLTGGSAKTPVNNDRTSSAAASSTALQDATRSVPGTTLRTIIVGAGVPVAVAGEGRPGLEFILKRSTSYTILFTADGASTVVAINADFYEV